MSTPLNTLNDQVVIPAPPSAKIRLSMLATAIVDALGGPSEFHSRFSFRMVSEMEDNHNFGLGKGVWTDDTSMSLCLAKSLATSHAADGFDEAHQLDTYLRWRSNGELSAIGRCFDIGNTISRALWIWSTAAQPSAATSHKLRKHTPVDPEMQKARESGLKQIADDLAKPACSGNGSLMRVLPIGLAYYSLSDDKIAAYARRSSLTTHPNGLCQEACEVWTGAIVRIIRASDNGKLTKLDLLQYFATFPYTQDGLRDHLAIPLSSSRPPSSPPELEEHYWLHHPLLSKIKNSPKQLAPQSSTLLLPSAQDLPSTGFVLHTLVCALYCFFATRTFEEGAIMAVNMGSDADTVGAVYGGLAGCWYAAPDEGAEAGDGLFWAERVRRWKNALVKRDMVEGVAEELVQFTVRLQGKS